MQKNVYNNDCKLDLGGISMQVKVGNFINDSGNAVEYYIEEEVVTGNYKIGFKEMGKILNYSKREASYKIEIYELTSTVEPQKKRSLDEYIELIREYYASNLKKISTRCCCGCDIIKTETGYKLETYDDGKKYIEHQAKIRGIDFNKMLEIIDNKKRNAYKR